ncbi:VOC family protein [Candidatus Gottesmanbacteria bacterium]|nr:VOC family protein [Candidatus Gottesmanbacteria bacterium]
MIKVNPYLNFNGDCEKAFNFYKLVFGGKFTALQRFKDIPKSEQPMPKKEGERIMHIALPIGKDILIMGSDISETMGMKLKLGNNMYISLHPDSKKEAERLFNKLSTDGKVEMPFQKMFWGAYFSSFTDKFGIQWMINYESK